MRETFIQAVSEFVRQTPYNVIQESVAFEQALVGIRIFEEPLVGFADVADGLFLELRKEGVIGEHVQLPLEWNPKGKTVISFFLPFTDVVKASNAVDFSYPSPLWMHGRVEGQGLCGELGKFVVSYLEDLGYQTVCPTIDARFQIKHNGQTGVGISNWSERHCAYICGLGTFGLSKGLITKKGIAGRFVSVITQLELEKTTRDYTGIYDYCTLCGACIRNCPVDAISFERGKEHIPCSRFLDGILEAHRPYYGCGKCQIEVPCMNGIPGKRECL